VEVNRNMGIVLVLTYGIKSEKHAEWEAFYKGKFAKFMTPKKHKGLISWRVYEQEYGGVAGTYVEMCEFKSLADYAEMDKNMESKEIEEMFKEWHKMKDPTKPVTKSIWNTVV
jgi:hypothetical protein